MKKLRIIKFPSGAVREDDEGKEDYIETISWTALKRYAEYMTEKKKKYGEGNFKKGLPIKRYERGIIRHWQKYIENKYEDGKTELDQDHLAAMIFGIFGIMHEESKMNKK